jgi:hypothetical protein
MLWIVAVFLPSILSLLEDPQCHKTNQTVRLWEAKVRHFCNAALVRVHKRIFGVI